MKEEKTMDDGRRLMKDDKQEMKMEEHDHSDL